MAVMTGIYQRIRAHCFDQRLLLLKEIHKFALSAQSQKTIGGGASHENHESQTMSQRGVIVAIMKVGVELCKSKPFERHASYSFDSAR